MTPTAQAATDKAHTPTPYRFVTASEAVKAMDAKIEAALRSQIVTGEIDTVPWVLNKVMAEVAPVVDAHASLVAALEGLLSSCAVTSKATDAELIDAREKGYAPEIREQAAAILVARAALAPHRAQREGNQVQP